MPDEPDQSSSSSGIAVTIDGLPAKITTGFRLDDGAPLIGPVIVVHVDPPDRASEISCAFQGVQRVNILEWAPNNVNGEISFRVEGNSATPCNCLDGDTVLNLMYEGESLASALVKVVVPHSIGAVHYGPGYQMSAGCTNAVVNQETVPAWPGVPPPHKAMVTLRGVVFTVPVVDQFKHGLDTMYDGSPVWENSNPINVSVSGGSYPDHVGFWRYRNGSLEDSLSEDECVLCDWVNEQPCIPCWADFRTEGFEITVGGHTLVKGIEQRGLILGGVNCSIIQVAWNQDPPDCEL